ncbi:MAG TPA: PD-(D/E)XK nuclease family protein [Flavobacteriales bacterium]|nr:PD-(D/E)XK nuclease family protein [Flavobacteriales bacterium]
MHVQRGNTYMEKTNKNVKERVLSASRLKTLETCSWSYWCNYHLKLPQKQNEGALRGTVCHLVFEMLIKKKHKKHFTLITRGDNIEASAAVFRLIMKHLSQMEESFDLPMTNEDNMKLMNDMILVGLRCDFFGRGGKVDSPEHEFLIKNENPPYKIRGFIDKPILYKKNKQIKIVDYKSSKYKFRGEELHSNIQAMVYTLASKKEWKGYKPTIEFDGLEYYLSHAFGVINNFTEETATTNYAADTKKNSWLCKIGKWRCPYIDPYDYFVVVNKKGEEIKKALKKKDLQKNLKKGEKIETRSYEGCPRHKPMSADNILDMFA